mgnify:CR=1 FL=1
MLLWAVAMFIPDTFIYIFTSHGELATYTRWAIRIYMAASGIFGIQIACQQTFIAIGNAKTSVFLAVLRKVLVLIPLNFYFTNVYRKSSICSIFSRANR